MDKVARSLKVQTWLSIAQVIVFLAVVLLLAVGCTNKVQSCIDHTYKSPNAAHQQWVRETCEFNVKNHVGTPEDGL